MASYSEHVNSSNIPYEQTGSFMQLDWNQEDGTVIIQDRHGSSNSGTRVEICDIDLRTHTTTGALRKCQQVVLQPYSLLLVAVGWRAAGKDSINSTSLPWRLFNFFFTTCLIGLQLYTFAYQVIACEGKLIIETDTHGPTTTPAFTNSTASIWEPILPSAQRRQCYHITTTYIVPAILHFTVYIMGFLNFRLQENEHLYALMEKVFLQHAPLNRGITQSNVIMRSRCYLYAGLLWCALAVTLQGLSAAAFGITPSIWFLEVEEKWWTPFLFGLQLFGFVICYLVQVAVFFNYATQCELLVASVNGIFVRLREKSTDLRVAMHDILAARENVSVLNGTISRMTAIGVLNFTELTVMGICLLVLNNTTNPWTWVYRLLFPLVFGTALFFPLVQAARVAKTGDKLRQICFEMRVFGFRDANQLELDSFVLFVSNATLRTKLFGVPIKPALIMSLVAGISLTLLILFQMGVIAGANILF